MTMTGSLNDSFIIMESPSQVWSNDVLMYVPIPVR